MIKITCLCVSLIFLWNCNPYSKPKEDVEIVHINKTTSEIYVWKDKNRGLYSLVNNSDTIEKGIVYKNSQNLVFFYLKHPDNLISKAYVYRDKNYKYNEKITLKRDVSPIEIDTVHSEFIIYKETKDTIECQLISKFFNRGCILLGQFDSSYEIHNGNIDTIASNSLIVKINKLKIKNLTHRGIYLAIKDSIYKKNKVEISGKFYFDIDNLKSRNTTTFNLMPVKAFQ